MGNKLPILRASYTTSYQDCPRRVAARLWQGIISAHGYSMNDSKQSIGAATGQSVHAGAQLLLQSKIDTGEVGALSDATDHAMDTLRGEFEYPIIWDDETPDHNQAEKVVVRQLRLYRAEVAPRIEPIMLEKRFEADYKGVILSGQMDVIEKDAGRDTKTGRICRNNASQYGVYSMLLKAHGFRLNNFYEDFVKRVRTGKPPEPSREIVYSPDRCEEIASRVITRMVSDLSTYQKTQDPGAFMANPHSMLCGENYCPAFGTDWCIEHKEK